MGEEINIIRIAVNDYNKAGGDKGALLNRVVSDIYAKLCEEYPQDDNSERIQCMIASLYAVLTAGCDEELMALIKPMPFVIIPVRKLHAELIAEPAFVDVINEIRTMFAGAFIKKYFDLYKRSETEYDTWLAKNMNSINALNSESVKKLTYNKDVSFKNYKNVLYFCDRYRPTVEMKIKTAEKKTKLSLV